jgi:hypothetical protein
MPAASLTELFQLERWLEEGFRDGCISQSVIPLEGIDISRQSTVANSPRIELKAIVGELLNHQHLFNGGPFTWDAWSGELQALVVTNRQTVIGGDTHYSLIGKLRACLMPLYRGRGGNPLSRWWNQPYIAITDIRAGGTEDTWSDEKNLDYTQLRYNLTFNIAPDAWPQLPA